jgi:alpha-glucuronidase
VDVTPWETASGGKAAVCPETSQSCAAQFKFGGAPGTYDVDVEYFDQNNGISKYRVFVRNELIDEWSAHAHLPATQPNGDSSSRRQIPGLALHPGDEVRIEGLPDEGERAPLDYVEIYPE